MAKLNSGLRDEAESAGSSGSGSAGDTASDMDHPLTGVVLILTGAVVQSLQYAWEEKVMSLDIGAPPLLLIGMEGFWGTLVCLFVLYPLAYNLPGSDHGCIENPYNTWVLLQNSKDIQFVFCLYFISIFGYNMLCALITFLLNSVWHAILDNFRPITVWGSDLFIYYSITTTLGEQWTQYSWIQVVALFVLLYGTAVYNAPNPGSIKLTGGVWSLGLDFTYEYDSMQAEAENEALNGSGKDGATRNLLTQSPHLHHMSPFRSGAASPAMTRLNKAQRENSLFSERNVGAGARGGGYGSNLEMGTKKERTTSFA